MIEEKIRKIFLEYPEVIYGFTDIEYSEYCKQYKSALVFAVPYGEQLTMSNYTEEKFDKGIQDAKKILEKILMQIENILIECEVKHFIPPVAQNNEEELIAPFSFKYAAVNAGLGWIGKNDVIITEKYGPRVRLSAILIDNDFTYGQKITKSECPVSCTKCVDICPYNALHNTNWDINTLRSEIIDYKLCNLKRSRYIKKHGRKNACGLCMVICPIGIKNRIWKDGNDKILDLFSEFDKINEFPAKCPVCGKKSAHLFIDIYNFKTKRSGLWVWCSECYIYSHCSIYAPEYWRNCSLVDCEKLCAIPDYLNDIKEIVDEHANRIINEMFRR